MIEALQALSNCFWTFSLDIVSTKAFPEWLVVRYRNWIVSVNYCSWSYHWTSYHWDYRRRWCNTVSYCRVFPIKGSHKRKYQRWSHLAPAQGQGCIPLHSWNPSWSATCFYFEYYSAHDGGWWGHAMTNNGSGSYHIFLLSPHCTCTDVCMFIFTGFATAADFWWSIY